MHDPDGKFQCSHKILASKLLVLPLNIVEKTFDVFLVASVNVVCGDAFADIARILNVSPLCGIIDGAFFAGSRINN